MAVYDVIIIGSGLGGLLCGNILSREGLNVCIIEKKHKLGGSLQTFGRKGCIFNTGLNYTESLDDGQVLNKYFRYFGLLNKLKLRRLDQSGFEVIDFNDGRYKWAMSKELFIETLSKEFPSEKNGLKLYSEKIESVCMSVPLYTISTGDTNMIGNDSISIGAADYIKSVISNKRLQNIVAGNSMLYSGTENKTSLFVHSLINNSFIESAWRIADGSHAMVDILAANITSNGGIIIKNNGVERIIMNNGMAEAVKLSNGEVVYGKKLIANVHPSQVIDWVDAGVFRKTFISRIRNLEDTMGMFTIYLVFKENSFKYNNYNFYHFNQDNVWIASNYNRNLWPQNYLFMPTAMSDSEIYAKSGSIITYMDYSEVKKWENTYTGDRGEDYLAFKNERAEILLDAVEKQFPGIRNHIKTYYTSTPLTWRDYTGTRGGSAYGILKDYNRPLESMILPRTSIPNLFLTGQNTNVHGILGVTISSVVTSSEIIDREYLINKINLS